LKRFYLDAADMLRPEGWEIGHIGPLKDRSQDIGADRWAAISVWMVTRDMTARTSGQASGPAAEARARLAAALRARAAADVGAEDGG
jgi:hypothetical protein